MAADTAPTALQTDIEAWLQHLRVERQLSAHTLAAYRRDTHCLLDYLATQRITQCQAVQEFHIRQLVATEHAKGLSGRSLQRLLSAWRQLFTWLGQRHQVTQNPVSNVRAPNSARKLPKTLDVDEMNHFLDIPSDQALTTRDRAMLELFYSSGLRLSELATLPLQALNLEDGLVRVTGKGNKVRLVPVGSVAIAAVRQWLSQHPDPHNPHAAVFTGPHGKALTPRAIQLRLKHHSLKQGMLQPVHPHMLRHAFASHLLQSSGDLRAVQELLGHANISTTQVYTHLDFQRLAAVYDAAHPRAQRRTPDASDS